MKRTGPTNTVTRELITELKQVARAEDAPVWMRVACDLEKPTRQRHSVNVYKISKVANDGDKLVIPGKVLGMGDISRKVTVAAHMFSRQAAEKIEHAGGKALAIAELLKQNPKGKNVRVVG